MTYDLQLFLFRKSIAVFYVGGAVSDNAGKRCAQIVGYTAQQIGPHFFLFSIHQKLFTLHEDPPLIFDLGCHGADRDGNDQHE